VNNWIFSGKETGLNFKINYLQDLELSHSYLKLTCCLDNALLVLDKLQKPSIVIEREFNH